MSEDYALRKLRFRCAKVKIALQVKICYAKLFFSIHGEAS